VHCSTHAVGGRNAACNKARSGGDVNDLPTKTLPNSSCVVSDEPGRAIARWDCLLITPYAIPQDTSDRGTIRSDRKILYVL